ncbi:MAG: GPW/gp25 family protein [Burkholderiales bacterium]|nr:GPW/gp25 family protein [Burkholderiales bacterium]
MANPDNRSDFLGRGWSFPPSFIEELGVVEIVADETDIRQSLWILFSTRQRERVMLPDYGSRLHEYVFGSMDETLYTHIKKSIADAVMYFEPRISLLNIDVFPDPAVDGMIMIALTYLIRQTNTRSNMVYPFYLAEGSNVRQIES